MKTYTDDALARTIYRIAAERIQNAGGKMPCTEAVFSAVTAAAPDKVSYRQLAGLDNADFLEAAYLLLLGRPLDDPSRESWKGSLTLPPQELQTLVLKTIMQSGEYKSNRIPLTDCPLQITDGTQQNLLISAQAMPQRLVRMYQKMPRFMQKLAKKAAGKE
ncbi:MAG: hypothetical protein IKH27_02340 [Oscillospiraceae bacterium]|nr:hypothetical protein [Oscillospiraceae bacterium]